MPRPNGQIVACVIVVVEVGGEQGTRRRASVLPGHPSGDLGRDHEPQDRTSADGKAGSQLQGIGSRPVGMLGDQQEGRGGRTRAAEHTAVIGGQFLPSESTLPALPASRSHHVNACALDGLAGGIHDESAPLLLTREAQHDHRFRSGGNRHALGTGLELAPLRPELPGSPVSFEGELEGTVGSRGRFRAFRSPPPHHEASQLGRDPGARRRRAIGE